MALSLRALVLAVALALLSPGLAAAAEADDVFTVSKVRVDEQAEGGAADARTVALARGERRAFTELMRRLALRADHGRLPNPGADTIASLVQDFAITNEKNSRVRYLAELTYRFKPAQVRALLRDHRVRYAETRSKPVVVLALYEEAGAVSLWDEPNPWRKAWEAAPPSNGLVPFIVPEGGLQDIATISAELAARGDEQRLKAIAGRYGTDAIIVARASTASGREGRTELSLTAASYGVREREQTIVVSLRANANETPEALMARAQRELAEQIEDRWKEANLIQFEQNSVLVAEMPLTSLKEWVEAQRRLRNVAQVQRVDLVLLSRLEARFNVFYLGDASQLKLALAQQDMALTEGEGSWTVTFNKPVSAQPAKGAKR
jgi:hypothetical protein